jgi:hypothetical protein
VSAESTQSRWQRGIASAVVVGVMAVLLLIAVGVLRYPASMQGNGGHLLRMDVGVLLVVGIVGLP